MKKIIAFLLAAMLVMSMAACAAKTETNTTTAAATTEAKVEEPASALEVLENTWAKYAEDEKFFAMGGMDAEGMPVDGAPGAVDLGNADYLQYNLLVPADNAGLITDCASVIHAMNANTFTCGAYKLVDGADETAFVTAMQTAIQGNQWMCGFPETLLIANVDGIIVVAFGVNDAMTPFTPNLTAAYAEAQIVVNEAIAG